MRVVGRKME